MDRDKFLVNYGYLLRLKVWADRRLKAVGRDKDMGLKGTGIAELDGRKVLESLSLKTPSYHMGEDIEFRQIVEKMNSPEGRKECRLGRLAALFHLSVAEQVCLFLSILPDIDGAYGKAFQWLNGNPGKSRPVLEVAADLMGLDQVMRCQVREEMGPDSPFVRYMLNQSVREKEEPFWMQEIVLDKRIAGYVLGIETGGEGLPSVRVIRPEDEKEEEKENKYLPAFSRAFCLQAEEKGKAVFLYGEEGSGKKELLKQFCASEGKEILLIKLEKEAQAGEMKRYLRQAVREAVLTGRILAAEGYEELDEEKGRILWEEMRDHPGAFIILSTEKPGRKQKNTGDIIPIHIEPPSYEERKDIWEHYLKKYKISTEEGKRLAAKFLFLPGQIREAARHYQEALRIQEGAPSLYESCFAQIDTKLYERASRIHTSYTWDQLILPESQKELLRHICAQMENKYTVYDKWGFGKTVAYGKGVTVVFSGPPGTGKTMAAQILSRELNLELFKVDLSQMVSKYVGETEKNLAAIFKDAETSNAILFFDEADSLFGKRTEVKSSNDRYANLETSYLLQRLEEYEGMTVLATNYLKNIDEAFMRRMKYIIQFQFPDGPAREKIWRVTMPKEAPLEEDIDYGFLGENLELAGGNIKNIAVYAAFLAAEKQGKIGMAEILKAARYEMQKSGKILLGKDLKHYGYLLEEN